MSEGSFTTRIVHGLGRTRQDGLGATVRKGTSLVRDSIAAKRYLRRV